MNKKEYKIVQQLRELEANVPPQVRTLRWFWSFQDLMAKFDPTDPWHDPALEVTPEEALALQEQARARQEGLQELDDAEVLEEDLKGEGLELPEDPERAQEILEAAEDPETIKEIEDETVGTPGGNR